MKLPVSDHVFGHVFGHVTCLEAGKGGTDMPLCMFGQADIRHYSGQRRIPAWLEQAAGMHPWVRLHVDLSKGLNVTDALAMRRPAWQGVMH